MNNENEKLSRKKKKNWTKIKRDDKYKALLKKLEQKRKKNLLKLKN